jgi:hypothetical protein
MSNYNFKLLFYSRSYGRTSSKNAIFHIFVFTMRLNGKEYPDDLGKTMPFDKFYKMMQEGAETKTSQVNADEFEAYFEPFLKNGKDILHVCLSSGISGCDQFCADRKGRTGSALSGPESSDRGFAGSVFRLWSVDG